MFGAGLCSYVLCSLVLLSLLVVCHTFKYCTKVDAAKCETDEGQIDLWSLARNDGQPRFKDVKDSSASLPSQFYSFNPGNSWSDTRRSVGDLNNCQNIAACVRYGSDQPINSVFANIGTQSSVQFIHDAKAATCTLSVKGKYSTVNTQTLITIVCEPQEEGKLDPFQADETRGSWIYRSTLHTKYACFSSPSSSALSIGSILLITLALLLVVYLVTGVLVNKYVRGRSGGKELCPNYGFWFDLPLLVKDGVVFSANRSKRSFGKEGYESI